MPSTPDPLFSVELMAAGEKLNTWGPLLNAALKLVIQGIAGVAEYTLSGSYSPTSTQYVENEARKMIHHITGGSGGTVTMPAVSFIKLVLNDASGAVTFSIGSGDTAEVAANAAAIVYSDGTDVRLLQDDSILAAAKAYTDQVAFATQAGDFPGMTGNAGKTLIVNPDEDAVLWGYARKPFVVAINGTTAMVADTDYLADSSAGTVTLTLPESGAAGESILVCDYGNAETNNVTIEPSGSDTIESESSLVIDVDRGWCVLIGVTGGWRIGPCG